MLDRLPNCPLLELNGWTLTTSFSWWRVALQVEIRRESPEFPMWCLSSKTWSQFLSHVSDGGRPFEQNMMEREKWTTWINIFWVSQLFRQVCVKLEDVCFWFMIQLGYELLVHQVPGYLSMLIPNMWRWQGKWKKWKHDLCTVDGRNTG